MAVLGPTRGGSDPAAPIALEVLGRGGLRAGADELRRVLVQPKRFGLLVFIALRRSGGFVRRDELLGAFWPDSTEKRARAALRQALRFLRRRLGPGVVVNRGRTALDPLVGVADRYHETLKPREGDHLIVIDAAGTLDDGRAFQFGVTHLEDQTRAIRLRFR